jgi:glyoxalase family protein
MATEIGYSIPKGSVEFWNKRFNELNVKHEAINERFGEQHLSFEDPDGLLLNLIVPSTEDNRNPWTTKDVKENSAIKGFHSVVLTVRKVDPTAKILTDIFGYKLLKQEGNRYRFITDAYSTANIVDIVEDPTGSYGHNAGGTNHHVAFRAKDDNIMMEFGEKVKMAGLNITEKIDRNYFYSLYFREPNGVLFEIASDNPGFVTDENINELGTHLMLPPQYESNRTRIEAWLPVLNQV